MLAAVQFEAQLCFLAKEIKNVLTHGMLPPEFVAAEMPPAEPAPHKLFRPRLLAAKLTCSFYISHAVSVKGIKRNEKFVYWPPL